MPGLEAGMAGLASAGDLTDNALVQVTTLEPRKLRPEIIRRIEALDDESLLVLHRLLLHLEKERLWHELSAEAEADRRSGKLDRLPGIIREARAELRQG
jgi:2-polyprenyl-6-methoxyphenol hydroxylase-like FAD-dependent oxidoreductase